VTPLVYVVLPVLLAAPQKFAPQFHYMASTSENTALSMECEGQPPFDVIECAFTQTMITVPRESDIQKKLTEARSASAADVAKLRKGMCPEISKADVSNNPSNATVAQKASANEATSAMKVACQCVDDRCFINEMMKFFELDAYTCHVYADTFRKTMRKAGKNRWVESSGPNGLCSVVQVATLELDPKVQKESAVPIEWVYSWVTSSADASASVFCKSFASEINVPHVFKWDVSRELVVPCRQFRFGF